MYRRDTCAYKTNSQSSNQECSLIYLLVFGSKESKNHFEFKKYIEKELKILRSNTRRNY